MFNASPSFSSPHKLNESVIERAPNKIKRSKVENSDEYDIQPSSFDAQMRRVVFTPQNVPQPSESNFIQMLAASNSIFVDSTSHSELAASLPEIGDWLTELLEDLAECSSCAEEEEITEPTDLALDKARQLLEELANNMVDRPEIYPIQESGVAIDFRGPRSSDNMALFVIEQDGSGVLYHRTSNSRGRLQVDDATALIEEGGVEVLRRLGIR